MEAGKAHVNLVVSATGLGAARALQELFGTPYVVGVPIGKEYAAQIQKALVQAVTSHQNLYPLSDLPGKEILVIGEGITSLSLASALELAIGKGVGVICPTECNDRSLRKKDQLLHSEEDIQQAMVEAKAVIADPLFQPICPKDVCFISLPSESFSGRLFREDIPNLVRDFPSFLSEVL